MEGKSCSNCKNWSKDEIFPIGLCLRVTTLSEYIKSFEHNKEITDHIIPLYGTQVYVQANHYCSNYNG